jgi:hypothetical protein
MPRLVEAQAAAGGRAPRVSALHTTDDRLGAQFDIGILRTSWRPEGGNFARSEPSVTLLAPPRRAEALQLAGLAGVEAETILVAETRNGEFEGWIGPPNVLADIIDQGRLVAPFPDHLGGRDADSRLRSGPVHGRLGRQTGRGSISAVLAARENAARHQGRHRGPARKRTLAKAEILGWRLRRRFVDRSKPAAGLLTLQVSITI